MMHGQKNIKSEHTVYDDRWGITANNTTTII